MKKNDRDSHCANWLFAWRRKGKNTMMDSTGRAIIPANVEEINKDAFCSNKNIKEVTVPSHIRRIGESAFRGCRNLTTVVLQEGLEEIGPLAFWCCEQIETIVIPASVKKVHNRAFGFCEGLKRVTVLSENTQMEDGVFTHCNWNMELLWPEKLRTDQRLHLFGANYLYRPKAALPPGNHTGERDFEKLADRCASMDADAMWEMADYLQSLGPEEAYTYAANFWRYRAQKAGHKPALQWLEKWISENPDVKMPSLLTEDLDGYFSGEELRFCGFLFFDLQRSYSIQCPDSDGVVEVSAWSSTEDADSDGFGMEECYDWWYLDEALQALPGVEMIHDYSNHDKRANQMKFQALHDKAAEIIRKRYRDGRR